MLLTLNNTSWNLYLQVRFFQYCKFIFLSYDFLNDVFFSLVYYKNRVYDTCNVEIVCE